MPRSPALLRRPHRDDPKGTDRGFEFTDHVIDRLDLKGAEKEHEDRVIVNLSGPTQTEFHMNRRQAWPKGSYQVTITLSDGASMVTSVPVGGFCHRVASWSHLPSHD